MATLQSCGRAKDLGTVWLWCLGLRYALDVTELTMSLEDQSQEKRASHRPRQVTKRGQDLSRVQAYCVHGPELCRALKGRRLGQPGSKFISISV